MYFIWRLGRKQFADDLLFSPATHVEKAETDKAVDVETAVKDETASNAESQTNKVGESKVEKESDVNKAEVGVF